MSLKEQIMTVIQELKFDAMLSRVEDQLRAKSKKLVRNEVRAEVDRYTGQVLRDKVDDRITQLTQKIYTELIEMVKNRITTLIRDEPIYDTKISTALAIHRSSIEKILKDDLETGKYEIEKAIHAQLDRIIREDQYRSINNALIEQLMAHVNNTLTANLNVFDSNLRAQIAYQIQLLDEMKSPINNAHLLFTSNNQQLATLQQQINSQQEAIKWLKLTNVFLIVGLVGFTLHRCLS